MTMGGPLFGFRHGYHSLAGSLRIAVLKDNYGVGGPPSSSLGLGAGLASAVPPPMPFPSIQARVDFRMRMSVSSSIPFGTWHFRSSAHIPIYGGIWT